MMPRLIGMDVVEYFQNRALSQMVMGLSCDGRERRH